MQSYGIAPTAMTADHGYIAAGAQRGMVCVVSTFISFGRCTCCRAAVQGTCGLYRKQRCGLCQGVRILGIILRNVATYKLILLLGWQLMVASTVDGSYVHCGEVGGSVVNALHLGKDPRGEGQSHCAIWMDTHPFPGCSANEALWDSGCACCDSAAICAPTP